jgi:hypothetical protein
VLLQAPAPLFAAAVEPLEQQELAMAVMVVQVISLQAAQVHQEQGLLLAVAVVAQEFLALAQMLLLTTAVTVVQAAVVVVQQAH